MTAEIVGRAEASGQLAEDIDRGAESLSFAIVRGVAGMGKTTIVDDVVTSGEPRSVLRVTGRPERTNTPLSLIAELVGRPDGTDPERHGDEAGAAVARAVTALLDHIASCTTDGPAVLVVDDLQWADPASVEVLRRSAARARHDRLTVVLALRPVPAPRDDIAGLLDMVRGLGAITVELGPLDQNDARRLIDSLTTDVTDAQARSCIEASGGNPLVLRHLAGAVSQGSSLTDSLRPLVHQRLTALPDDAAREVAVAAVGGSRIRVDALADLLDTSADAVERGLDHAAGAALVYRDSDGWRFDHDLVREAVVETLEPADRADLHRRWAAVAWNASTDDAGPAAAHLLAAGPPFESWEIDVLLASAVEALHTSPATAVEAFTAVLDHTEPDDDRHRSARTGAAEARLWSTRHDDPDDTADVDALTRLRQEFAQGRVSHSTLTEAEATARASLTGSDLDETLARIATIASTAHQPLPHLLDELHERADSLSPLAEVWLRHAQDRSIVLTGEFVESMWIGERAKAAGDRLPEDHPARVEAAFTFGRLACQLERRRPEGFDALRWAEQRAEELGSTALQLDVYLEHGIQLKMWDRWDEADARFTAGAALAEEHGAAISQDLFELELMSLAVPRGDTARAEEIVAGRAGRPDPVAFWAAHVGHLRMVEDELDLAIRTLVPLAEGRDVYPEVRRLALEVLAVAAYVADDDRARDALRTGCRLLGGDARPARVCRAMVLATADGAGEVADTVLGDVVDAPPLIRGKYELLAGIAHRRSGNAERAIECLRSSYQRARNRGANATARIIERTLEDLGVRTATRTADRPVTGWGAITPAEMRVVELVAEGLVYREVAERLFISRRTVESHVASALRKLELRNRSQLATAFLAEGAAHVQ